MNDRKNGITLPLTVEQAQALTDMIGHGVAGNPVLSRRRLLKEVADELDSQGFNDSKTGDTTGLVYFATTWERDSDAPVGKIVELLNIIVAEGMETNAESIEVLSHYFETVDRQTRKAMGDVA